MFSSFFWGGSSSRRQQEEPREDEAPPLKVVFLGLDGSGKTSTVRRLNPDDHTNHYLPTYGESIAVVEKFGLVMQIWDVGGNKWMRLNWKDYVIGADALIYFIDAKDVQRFPEALQELSLIIRQPPVRNIPIVVCANKTDYFSHLSLEEVKACVDPVLRGHARSTVFLTSAHTGAGFLPAFTWLRGQLYQQSIDFWRT